MKYTVYSYDGTLYAVPVTDTEEIRLCEKQVKESNGRFARFGEFTVTAELNVSPKQKWFGYGLHNEKTPFLKLVQRTNRNADYML